MRCAQRGCKLPEDRSLWIESPVCPTCNNPLVLLVEPEDVEEVSHAQLGEDGALLAVPAGEATELPDEAAAQFESPGGADDPS